MAGPINDPRTPNHARRTSEELQRARDRRQARDTPEDRLVEEMWTDLYGDRRKHEDTGRIGRLEERQDKLERRDAWLAAVLFTGLVALVVDILVRTVH